MQTNNVRDRILTLAKDGYTDGEIVRSLRREGFKNKFGRNYSKTSVYWYRHSTVNSTPTTNVVSLPSTVSIPTDTTLDLMTGIRSVLNLKGVPSENKIRAIASLVS